MNRSYEVDKVLYDLKKKKCKVTYNGLVYVIDISSAENLGNKTWAKIGYLMGYHDAKLIGKSAYMRQGGEQKEKESIKIQECVVKTSILTP